MDIYKISERPLKILFRIEWKWFEIKNLDRVICLELATEVTVMDKTIQRTGVERKKEGNQERALWDQHRKMEGG